MIRQTDCAFGLTFTVVFSVISGVAWWAYDAMLTGLLAVAGIFLIVAHVAPGILLPLNRLWAAFAARLSVVSNHLILGVFFLAFLLPMNLVMRLIGRDPMQRTLESTEDSYWSPVNRQAMPETLPDMF